MTSPPVLPASPSNSDNPSPSLASTLNRQSQPPLCLFNLYLFLRQHHLHPLLDLYLDILSHEQLCRLYTRDLLQQKINHRESLISSTNMSDMEGTVTSPTASQSPAHQRISLHSVTLDQVNQELEWMEATYPNISDEKSGLQITSPSPTLLSIAQQQPQTIPEEEVIPDHPTTIEQTLSSQSLTSVTAPLILNSSTQSTSMQDTTAMTQLDSSLPRQSVISVATLSQPLSPQSPSPKDPLLSPHVYRPPSPATSAYSPRPKTAPKSRQDLIRSALRIYHRYIHPHAPQLVLIPKDMATQIQKQVEQQHRVEPAIFNPTKEWVYEYLETHIWPEFLKERREYNIQRSRGMVRGVLGVLGMFIALTVFLSYIFLDAPREYRLWGLIPLFFGVFLFASGFTLLSPLFVLFNKTYAFFGISFSSFFISEVGNFKFMKVKDQAIRQYQHKKALRQSGWCLLAILLITVLLVAVPGYRL